MKICELLSKEPVDIAAQKSDDRLKNLDLMKKRESLKKTKLKVKKQSNAIRKASQPDPIAWKVGLWLTVGPLNPYL